MSNDLWLVTTEHLKHKLWFNVDEDFNVGMNYVALCVALSSVRIMAFALMSNHVHFVLGGSRNDCNLFITRLKQSYSSYHRRKYLSQELLRGNEVDFKSLSLQDDSFKRAVAYVQMNPVAANICTQPHGYPWGTGNMFFNDSPVNGKKIGDLSKRAQERFLHSKILLPPAYIADDRGFISPISYVQTKFVESVFRTPSNMNYFLQQSSKSLNENKQGIIPTFRDHLVYSAMEDLCGSLFGRRSFKELDSIQRIQVVKQLRRRFSASAHQISRVISRPVEEVIQMLDTF